MQDQEDILDFLRFEEPEEDYWKDLCNTNIKQKYTLFEENQKLKAENEELEKPCWKCGSNQGYMTNK